MLKVGMPRDSVVQALERDGKSASILDLDPEKSYASQTAAAAAADESGGEETKSDVLLKDDPEYSKFFKVRVCLLYVMIETIVLMTDLIPSS